MVQEAASEPVPQHSGSYFARHWRGELSLAKSWWLGGVVVNGLVVGMLFGIAVTVTTMLFDNSRGVAVVLLSIQLILTIVAYIWALVGTWRAAVKHTGSKFWSIVARVMMVLGIFVSLANIAKTLEALSCYASSDCEIAFGRR